MRPASLLAVVQLGIGLGLVACGGQTPPPSPGSFERPGQVAFVCMRTQGTDAPQAVPLTRCAGSTPRDEFVLHALVTQTSRGEVAAVDLERSRVLDSRQDIPGFTFLPVGEIPSAIVVPPEHPELTYVANFGSRDLTVLQTRAFRDLGVGEDPVVQTVKLRLPASADASAGSPVAMALAPDEDALFVAAPDRNWLLRLPLRRCQLPGAANEDAGAPCIDGTIDEGGITSIPLTLSLSQATAGASNAAIDPYRMVCPSTTLLETPEIAPPDASSTATAPPEPVALAIDAHCRAGESCIRRLLVADRALPIIHVIDLDLLAAGQVDTSVLPPIVTGVPTHDVAVTPRVPVTTSASDASETQYVYAIDGTDGSVLVTENGALLSVSAASTSRPDRIGLDRLLATGAPVARAIEVITPNFDVSGASAPWAVTAPRTDGERSARAAAGARFCEDNPTGDPARLSGVFLAIAVSDGTVRIVDVHDIELANCRAQCSSYPAVRHRPRFGRALQGELPGFSPISQPLFRIGNSVIPVQATGTTVDPRIEGLACVACQPPLGVSFPDPRTELPDELVVDAGLDASFDPDTFDAGDAGFDAAAPDGGSTDIDAGSIDLPPSERRCIDGEARVCTVADPWTPLYDWIAAYEGVISGTRGGRGQFLESATGSLVDFGTELALCSLGVLGDDELGAGRGDQLAITAPLPETSILRQTLSASITDPNEIEATIDDCRTLVRTRDEGGLIAFPIRRVFDDRLVIDTRLVDAPAELPAARRTHAFVASCFARTLLTYEIRTRGAYTVTGSVGFLHRVVHDEDTGRCVIDDTQSPVLASRAYEDTPFTNGLVSFQIVSNRDGRGRPIVPERDTILQLTQLTAAPKLVLDATVTLYDRVSGVLASDLRYNPIDARLYLVDIAERGLVPISLTPFPVQAPSSFE